MRTRTHFKNKRKHTEHAYAWRPKVEKHESSENFKQLSSALHSLESILGVMDANDSNAWKRVGQFVETVGGSTKAIENLNQSEYDELINVATNIFKMKDDLILKNESVQYGGEEATKQHSSFIQNDMPALLRGIRDLQSKISSSLRISAHISTRLLDMV